MEYMRESIILSSIRTFCKTFAGIIGILVGLVVVVIALMLFSTPDIYPPKSSVKIAPDAQGSRELLSTHTPAILKLNITGVIGQGDLTTEKITNCLLDSREGLFSGNRVKAILLHIDSPGGTVDDSDGIYESLMEYKKKYQVPVYAFVDGLCASGGMYIASSADKIFATAPSIIGSVGVILGPTFNVSGLMERYGVASLTVSKGKDKDMLNPFRPWQPGEDVSLKTIVGSLYERFVSIVVSARPKITKEELVDKYGAQIFVAKEAEQFGFIDVANSDYQAAVAGLAHAAGFSEKESYQVLSIGPAHPLLSSLTEGKLALLKGKITHQFQFSSSLNSELGGKFLYLYQPN